MKKTLCAFVLMLIAVTMHAIDPEWIIELDNDNKIENRDLDNFCRVRVTCQPSDDSDKAIVNIDIQNLSNSKFLLVFDKNYTEKDLKQKKYPYSYKFNKKEYWGTHTAIEVKGVEGLDRIVTRDRTTGPEALLQFSLQNEEEKIVKIPVYLASVSGSNKLIIEDMQQITLNIKVHTKKDELLPRLTSQCDELLKELEEVKFYRCPWAGQRKQHYASIRSQQDKYRRKIDALKKDFSEGQKSYTSSDKKYEEYQDLINQLDNIDLNKLITDCPKEHPRPPHECAHCKAYKNTGSAGTAMEKLFRQYDNGDKGAKSKAQSLYNAVHSDCPVLKGKWGTNDRAKADKYYRQIK